MNVKFKSISFYNFLSYEKGELDLSIPGYILVEGKNNFPKDNALSNGAGKSAIFDAISWAITGETLRGVKDVKNLFLNDGPAVILDFNSQDTEYRLIRSRDNSNYGTCLKLYVNKEDKSGKGLRDTEAIIKQYLPDLTCTLLNSVILLGQGLPQRFSNNTPSGRKEILEELSKSDFMISDIKDKLSLRKTVLAQKLRELEDTQLKNNTLLSSKMQEFADLKSKLESFGDRSELENTLKNLKAEQDGIERSILETNATLDNALEEKTDIASKRKDVEIKCEQVSVDAKNKYQESLTEVSEKIREKLFIINDLKKKIIDIQNIKDICPTCGQKLPDVHKPDSSKLEEELISQNMIFKNLNEERNKIEQDQKAYEEEKKKSLLLDLEKLDAAYNDICLKIDSIKQDLYNLTEKQKISISKISDINNKIIQFDTEKKALQVQKELCNENIAYLTADIDKTQRAILDIKDHQTVVNKMLTIATRDFRGYLLQNIISYIDKKCKEYSKVIFDTDLLSVKQNGNNIDILYNNKSIESLSGGERQKVDLIIQFSLRDMLCSTLDFSSNILVVDECFDNLDSLGCQKVLELITRKLNTIETIYIISHHSEDLNIPYDDKIEVVKNSQGISSIM